MRSMKPYYSIQIMIGCFMVSQFIQNKPSMATVITFIGLSFCNLIFEFKMNGNFKLITGDVK